ncbi:MAG: arginyl-tRNA synthetase [Solirubrobacteraceae bacterium]|nr:arginyl-tRNA synthetase [Solirubrobacteraceae bacterium]
MTPLGDLRAAVQDASASIRGGGNGAGSPPTLERARKPEFGDYSTNAAMLLAPALGEPPRAIAEKLAETLAERLGDRLDRAEVAGPGFLNLFLADAWYRDALRDVLEAGDGFGGAPAGTGERVLVEFVSANPTGPLTAAGGRHAAYGDALARILEFRGDEVEREYYINDHGTQVRKLGESIRARARGEDVPEGGYEGEYVRDLAAELPGAADGDPDELGRQGAELMVARIRATLHRYRVDFDTWFSERTLHEAEPSPVEQHYEELERDGHVFRSEGAVWLRTSAFGDDKDRVLRRSSGEHTYFAADVAYHESKRERGFDRLIDVWGADHHGYVARVRAAFAALGGDPDTLELIIMQFVNVIERGERASMSKRRGDFVTLDDLLDEIGVDAARFFLLQRSHDTTVDLDLDLARQESSDNPVYYVQYAHARIASLRQKAGEARVEAALAAVGGGSGPDQALDPAERTLINKLVAFPGEVEEAAARRAPHRLAVYALELAQEFTAFYRDCRVVGAEPEAVESFRLALSVAAQRTIARALDLLGVTAPDEM